MGLDQLGHILFSSASAATAVLGDSSAHQINV
jgi:hypothetical protein